MLLLRTEALPDDRARWVYQLKLDGYRAVAFKTQDRVSLRSRNDNDFNSRYPAVVRGLKNLPNDTVVDGEVVALDPMGRPSFNALQNAGSSVAVVYYLFDLMVLKGADVTGLPLEARQRLLEDGVLPKLAEPVRPTANLDAPLQDLLHSVKQQRLEGLVAKRRDSRYQPGQRTGAWLKMRVNRSQPFVIGGYTVGTSTFDAVIAGYVDKGALLYAARTRSGFTPATRAALFARFRRLERTECPFANLPEARSGRWGQGLTKDKMAACRWLEPVLVGQFEFVEWTSDDHLRHSRFVGLREDVPPSDATRE
jgi:bifunctional non-homologous end joining protein LigD